jgi:pimeloyl-ACP methyl ester carboxylesterase
MWAVHRQIDQLRTAAREQTLVAMLSIPRLLRHPVWRDADRGQGDGQGVLLVPGFGFGDRSLALMARWLRARGYQPASAGIGLNVGCTTDLVDRIEQRLEQHTELTGRPVVLLGQSRGGGLARLAAARRPDLVRGLVMLASPNLDPLGANPQVLRLARKIARMSAMGVPHLLDEDCLTGPCFQVNSKALVAPLPRRFPTLVIYSRFDTIAPWHLCLEPDAECVEVRSSHTGMGLDPDVFAALRPRLAEWAAGAHHVQTHAMNRSDTTLTVEPLIPDHPTRAAPTRA